MGIKVISIVSRPKRSTGESVNQSQKEKGASEEKLGDDRPFSSLVFSGRTVEKRGKKDGRVFARYTCGWLAAIRV